MEEEKAYLYRFFQKTLLWASGFGLATKEGQSLPLHGAHSRGRTPVKEQTSKEMSIDRDSPTK